MLVDIEIKFNGLTEDELAILLYLGFGAVNSALPTTEKLADLVQDGTEFPANRTRDLVRVALAGYGLWDVRKKERDSIWQGVPHIEGDKAREWCLKQVLRAYEETPPAE